MHHVKVIITTSSGNANHQPQSPSPLYDSPSTTSTPTNDGNTTHASPAAAAAATALPCTSAQLGSVDPLGSILENDIERPAQQQGDRRESPTGSDSGSGRAVTNTTAPVHRLMRRTSHTLLYVPEQQRRVSTVSGTSVSSCPSVENQPLEATVRYQRSFRSAKASLQPSPTGSRRKSVQTGASAIGFRPLGAFERRSSQPTLGDGVSLDCLPVVKSNQALPLSASDHKTPSPTPSSTSFVSDAVNAKPKNILTKRVSWLSMKSLQETAQMEPLLAATNKSGRNRRRSGQNEERTTPPLHGAAAAANHATNRSDSRDSRMGSQFGSVLQLDMHEGSVIDRNDCCDTPPMDTLSWSFAG
uniref:Uncharacterized protein n=1 Tax=Plectus sambesii TaxID=2011161 RepID=A0A914UNL6_9BILA